MKNEKSFCLEARAAEESGIQKKLSNQISCYSLIEDLTDWFAVDLRQLRVSIYVDCWCRLELNESV